ncbi:hypothetical protein [Paenibacillus taichungensis]
MAKPRPIELHVNSKGAKKHQKLQELIHDEDKHLFLPIDGRRKTDLYNKGLMDGRKEAIPLYTSYSECSDLHAAVIAIPRETISSFLTPKDEFIGVIQLDRTFLIDTREANRFIQDFCNECEYVGTPQCFKELDYDCAEEDRDKYSDTPYLMRQQEIRKARRKRTPFPA